MAFERATHTRRMGVVRSAVLLRSSSLAVLCSFCIQIDIKGCSSFQNQLPLCLTLPHQHHVQSRLCPVHSTISDTPDKSMYDINNISWEGDEEEVTDSNSNSYVGPVELWLDLRGTSLTPKTALELWDLEEQQYVNNQQYDMQELDQDSLTKPPFVKCLMSSTQINAKRKIDANNIEVLLVAEEDNNSLKSIFQHSNNDDAVGKILSLETTKTSSSSMPILPDPLPAIEVASSGKWVVVDTNDWKKIDNDERISMILPLVELLSSGVPTNGSGGGIGLTCHTNDEVVKAAMFFNGIGGGIGAGSGCTKTLESGIMIPDKDTKKEDRGNISSLDGEIQTKEGDSTIARWAMIVPFDMTLLQTAKLLLFG